ncbi:hypothetical protein BH23GEM9_BH23GEM9_30150 [soil metagenome]
MASGTSGRRACRNVESIDAGEAESAAGFRRGSLRGREQAAARRGTIPTSRPPLRGSANLSRLATAAAVSFVHSCAALAPDDHAGTAGRDLANDLEHLHHLRVPSHQPPRLPAGRIGRVGARPQRRARRTVLEDALQQAPQVVQVERFGQEVRRAFAHCRGNEGQVVVGRHQDDIDGRGARLQQAQEFDAVHARHTHVPVSDVQRRHLERIRHSSWHLVHIIDEVLTYSRSEAGLAVVRHETVDLSAVVEELTSMMGFIPREKNVMLRLDAGDQPVHMVSDAGKIRQIVTNLLGNAVKFTDTGEVVVSISADGESVTLQVCDTGPGIPADQLEAVFEPFVQGDSSPTREKGGSGLGLTVAVASPACWGGDVALDSAPGDGCTFTLTLPVTPPGER